MKSIALLLCLSAAATVPAAAHATGCGSATTVAADVWAAVKDKIQCVESVTCTTLLVGKVVDIGVSLWNQLAGNSWAAIGPRALVSSWQGGNVVGTTGRVWVTRGTGPVGTGVVRLKKLDGKGKVGVAFCSTDVNGTTVKVADIEIPEGDGNIGQVWTQRFANANQLVISAHIDGKSVARSFKYEIQIGQ